MKVSATYTSQSMSNQWVMTEALIEISDNFIFYQTWDDDFCAPDRIPFTWICSRQNQW